MITAENAVRLKCRILAEGANGPNDAGCRRHPGSRRDEVFIIPDILCNSGGVIVSYFDGCRHKRLFWTEAEVNKRLETLLDGAFAQVQARAAGAKRCPTAPPPWPSVWRRCGPESAYGDFSRRRELPGRQFLPIIAGCSLYR